MDVDIQRGKRYHKLYRLLSLGKATLATWRFNWHSAALWIVLIIACTICFASLTVSIDSQVRQQ